MLRDISLRYKVPLNLTLAILFTGLVVASVLVWRAGGELRTQLFEVSVDLGRAMSSTLASALKHDDVWRAYQELKAASPRDAPGRRSLILLDADNRVFVSSDPARFDVTARLRDLDSAHARLARLIESRASFEPFAEDMAGAEQFFVVTPLVDDGLLLGTLVIGYPSAVFRPQLQAVAVRVAWSVVGVIMVLMPFGWYVGKRAVAPLVSLTESMDELVTGSAAELRYAPPRGSDEIAKLGQRFVEMVRELEEKRDLERQMVVSERLAALGRLAAGVAHEINNPLGGMLNALSTFRRFGAIDARAEKTVSLLERGLQQIRETVAALLVEARAESHALTPQDIDDVRTLVQSGAQKKSLQVDWDNRLDGPLPLPATPVRQVLLNLSLNAVQAAAEGGAVRLTVSSFEDVLDIRVWNDGRGIPEQELPRVFEPFVRNGSHGSGLGLWVTYQIVHQLHGEILVTSSEGDTCFTVRVPLMEAA